MSETEASMQENPNEVIDVFHPDGRGARIRRSALSVWENQGFTTKRPAPASAAVAVSSEASTTIAPVEPISTPQGTGEPDSSPQENGESTDGG